MSLPAEQFSDDTWLDKRDPKERDFSNFVDSRISNGAVYRKLFELKKSHPEVAHQVDDIMRTLARSVREIKDHAHSSK